MDGDSWDYQTSLGSIGPSHGLQFWGITDLYGSCGSQGFESIRFPDIDVSAYREVVCSFDVQVEGYDNGDDMSYIYYLDGTPGEEVLFIDGGDDLSTGGWRQVTIEVPNAAQSFGLEIRVKQNGSDVGGIDQVRLSGKPFIPCEELLISEYIEGTSSTTHRNNYLEVYNPTSDTLALEPYDLVKYTGSSYIPSASLALTGSLGPYDAFIIESDRESLGVQADLSTNSAVMNYNGDDKIALRKHGEIIDLVGTIGDSTDFAKDVTLRRKSLVTGPNREYDISEWESLGLEDLGNIGAHATTCSGALAEIEVFGNGMPITDGQAKTSILNNTFFGSLEAGSGDRITRSYTIRNIGNAVLEIRGIQLIGTGADNYQVQSPTSAIIPVADSATVVLSYTPKGEGLHTAELRILSNDDSEGTFNFTLQGEGTYYTNSPLMISQYYEGQGNNRWLEVTNVGKEPVADGAFFIALFWNEDALGPVGIRPSRKRAIPDLQPGESVKFSATLNVTAPEYAMDGKQILTGVCSFTGDDILVISETDDETCWERRVDRVGLHGDWGTDISMLRKYGCDQRGTHSGFIQEDWKAVAIEEIDNASSGSSLRIGEYYLGPTSFQSGLWQNGIPDSNREAVIQDDYNTGSSGSLATCTLDILEGAKLFIEPGDHVQVARHLNVEGTLEISHQGSLVMTNDLGTITGSGVTRVHKSSSPMQAYDYTYWSSPVKSARLEEVFYASPPGTFYAFDPGKYTDSDLDGQDDDGNAWVLSSGFMQPGRGYTAMAPKDSNESPQHVIFQGKPNNGRIFIGVGMQGSQDGDNDWNLIGNPYPSALDADRLLAHPENSTLLGGTLYFWTHSTPLAGSTDTGDRSYSSDDYAMYTFGTGGIKAHPDGQTPNGYIASGQGFFAEALSAGNILFENAMRTTSGNDSFFKAQRTKKALEKDRLWLNLYNEKGAFSQILIGFIDGASPAFDTKYDGNRLNGNRFVSFYSVLGERKLAVLGTSPFRGEERITLGVDSSIQGPEQFFIGLEHVTGVLESQEIILIDRLNNSSQDLRKGPYSFRLPGPGEVRDRFVLQFKRDLPETGSDNNTNDKLVWHADGEDLIIGNRKGRRMTQVQVFDLNGRLLRNISNQGPEARIYWGNLPERSIFLIRAVLEDSRIVTAKILL